MDHTLITPSGIVVHEDVEYVYVFHDLATHNGAGEIHYSISKTNYYMLDGSFHKHHEMLEESVEGKDFKDQASVMNHIATLNKSQLKSAEKKRKELQSILSSAPNSDHISNVIKFHDEVIGIYLEWFNKKNIPIYPKIRSSGRPKGSRNKLTNRKYNWVRDKYYLLKKKKTANTIKEYSKLIRSDLKTNAPKWWGKNIYTFETIMDIIKKQKWGD